MKRTSINPQTLTAHIVAWFFMFCTPFLFLDRDNTSIDWARYLNRLSFPLSMFIVFYVNYLVLVPKVLLKQKTRRFFLYNLLLIIAASALIYFWKDICPDPIHLPRPRRMHRPPLMRMFFICQNAIMLIFDAGFAAAIGMSKRWSEAEAARQQAELGRKEAELKNLRNQINPHFLLNTLNNIYALTAFNSERAQTAIQQLSKLLRHILYDNQENCVDLRKEIEFLDSYIELMRIRLPQTVDLQIRWNIPGNSHICIAPLIFISLIENAFKHGISPTEPSFIHIEMCIKNTYDVYFRIENSNFPKKQNDKSGSGIGLKQVAKRLDLMYHGRYEWTKGVSHNGKIYTSTLLIKETNQDNGINLRHSR